MRVSSEIILTAITEVLRSAPTVNDEDGYVYRYVGINLPPISSADIASLVEIISSFDEGSDGSVTTRDSYEISVQTNRMTPARALREGISLDDRHSGLSYTLGRPSDAYAIYMLLRLIDATDQRQRMQALPPSPLIRSRIAQSDQVYSVLDVVKSIIRGRTLRVASQSPRPKAEWKQYADAFFFHVGYNLDLALTPDWNFSDRLRPARISSLRRSRPSDLDVPRRHYVADLVYHYQLGVSAESPMLEYLSYYHVAEHWFENIYQDDLVDQIQQAITSPDFSYRRKKDLRDLIRKISRAVQLRDEQLVINEQVALRLTLEKYVSIQQLAADLNTFDPTLLNWYSSHVVSFCEGNIVSFEHPEDPDVAKALANRIYRTRNALVHSKEGSKGKFSPFSDDRELVPEVPLMRFVAEQIILATSTVPA